MAVFSPIDFPWQRAGYDRAERAHGGLELCDQERQKDLPRQDPAAGGRQVLVSGDLASWIFSNANNAKRKGDQEEEWKSKQACFVYLRNICDDKSII